MQWSLSLTEHMGGESSDWKFWLNWLQYAISNMCEYNGLKTISSILAN